MAGRKTPFAEEPGWSINMANSEARFVSPEEYAAQKKGPSILGRVDELIDMILSRKGETDQRSIRQLVLDRLRGKEDPNG